MRLRLKSTQFPCPAAEPFRRCWLLGFSLFMLVSCSEAVKEEAPENKKEESKTTFKLPVVIAKATQISDRIDIPGVVAALPDHSVKISPAIAGKIVSISVVPGSHTLKGEVIAILDDTHLRDQLNQSKTAVDTANVAIKQAKSNLDFAKENVERQKRLFDAEVSAKKDIIAAESQVATAQSQVETAQSQLHSAQAVIKQNSTEIAFTKVHSSIDGVVANRFLNVGDSVDPNTPILQIVDLKKVIVNAQIAVELVGAVKTGDSATITVSTTKDDNQNRTADQIEATITSISPLVDAQTNTVRVQLQCANTAQTLKEGEQVTVAVKSKKAHSVILLPQTALVPDPDDPKKQMVYVVENGKAHRVTVEKRAFSGDKVEIIKGLKPGQKVIAKDAYGLPDQSAIEEVRLSN
ncbi:MAG: efflux RND transporter periplasmic adaptor subunit [Candidatus Obscuribacterales bacterium]|nr:efflux RND transporter periplasmic adaptor subunit [Candidatus Obscuribacterales bacterium]